ncbi:MAG: TorF family putative porin [Parvibaculales bacterium]
MTKMQKTLAALLVSSTALTGLVQAAEVEANVGITSDYIWRGVSQNNGGTSASGGLDVSYESGAYVGLWVGDTAASDSPTTEADFGTQELDLYFGYAGEAGGLSYDVGYLAYMYPSSQSDDHEADFSEVYVTLGKGPISVSYYYLADGDDADAGDSTYVAVDYETELGGDYGFSLHYGIYDGDFVGEDSITDIVATVSKGDFSLALVTTDGDGLADTADEDPRFVASWGTSF